MFQEFWRVPSGISGMQMGLSATLNGEPKPSFPPSPPMLEKGGGVVIPCTYRVCPKSLKTALTVLQQHNENMSEKRLLKPQCHNLHRA